MRVIIYNTNSFGGNYAYSKCLAEAYQKNEQIEHCEVILPQNNNEEEPINFKQYLIKDLPKYRSKLLKKIHFLYRSIINPLKFYWYLRRAKNSVVVFNDYDQLTSFIWAPLYKRLKKKHLFAVILHDANRDAFMPTITLSNYTMAKIMQLMDIAFYHEILPDKVYYQNECLKVKIPHGIYTYKKYDSRFLDDLINFKERSKLVSILGNIRDEKNYDLAVQALAEVHDIRLLVAGPLSSSEVPTKRYKSLIRDLGIQDRVKWIEKFLSEEELQSSIMASDVILLYYKQGFTSQSGILNLVAPHKKKLIVSNVPSALRETVKRFNLGQVVDLNKESLISSLQDSGLHMHITGWDKYVNYASWDYHVNIAVNSYEQISDKKFDNVI